MYFCNVVRACCAAGVFFFFVTMSGGAFASEPSARHVPVPDWVRVQDYDPEALRGQPTNGAAYLLVSLQRQHSDADEAYYSRFVTRVVDIASAEDVSQISISFDPEYEKLELHHITVTRAGEKQDRFDLSRLKLLQNETEADRLVYNERVTASYILTDVRLGDIIDYSYTIVGKNPVFAGHIGGTVPMGYNAPIGRHYVRVQVPDDRPYYTGAYAEAPEPEVITENGYRILEWDRPNLVRQKPEEDEPDWYKSYAEYDYSDWQDWAALGNHYTRYYQMPETVSAELSVVIDSLQASASTDKERLRAALDYVQTNIRYLGIESGTGGYAPRDPSKILAQRFGDCKDKAVLLLTLMHHLGIKGQPALVDTDTRDHFTLGLPGASSFDHVIVHAEIDGQSYWLDPTRASQIGDMDNLQQAYFGAAVVINGTQSKVMTMPSQLHAGRRELYVTENFNLVDTLGAAELHVTTVYWGNRADSVLRRIAKVGRDEVQKDYLTYYAGTYATIQNSDQIQVVEDRSAGTITIDEWYEIPDAWTLDEAEGRKTFTVWPSEVTSAMPEKKLAPRSTPRDIGARSNIRHELVFEVDPDWNFSTGALKIENPAFEYSKTTSFSDGIYREVYDYVSKSDHVAVADLDVVNNDLAKASDAAGIEIFQPTASAFSEDTYKYIGYGTLVFIGCLFLWIFIKAVAVDHVWRSEAIFFPISLPKFLIMSVFTFGLYLFFWTYKNWQWVRDVQGERILVLPRAIFASITNFSLFPRIASYENQEDSHMKLWAGIIPLFIFIIGGVSRVIGRIDTIAPGWSLIELAIIPLMVPFVREVLRLNKYNQAAIDRNSRYTWHSYCALVPGAIFLCVMAYVTYLP